MEIKGNRICFYICNSLENYFPNRGRGSQFSKVLWAKSIFRFRVELKADISVGEKHLRKISFYKRIICFQKQVMLG